MSGGHFEHKQEYEVHFPLLGETAAEIARLRLTDEEREALEFFGAMEWPAQSQQIKARSGTIRALLKRLGDKT